MVQVGKADTVPAPMNTTPTNGTGPHRTHIVAVNTVNHGFSLTHVFFTHFSLPYIQFDTEQLFDCEITPFGYNEYGCSKPCTVSLNMAAICPSHQISSEYICQWTALHELHDNP